MARGKALAVPRALLIYCEGKTEAEYFNILLDLFRPPAYVTVEVCGQRGQHIALVDSVVAKRSELCGSDMGLVDEEIECWAVCDEDQMPCSYVELANYASERNVNLAFSAPQFEMYLLQHFEQSGDANRLVVFKKLSGYRRQFGGEGDYDDNTKADLGWMRDAIDRKPKIVKTAVINAGLRNHTTKRPFLTVQNLVERIINLSSLA